MYHVHRRFIRRELVAIFCCLFSHKQSASQWSIVGFKLKRTQQFWSFSVKALSSSDSTISYLFKILISIIFAFVQQQLISKYLPGLLFITLAGLRATAFGESLLSDSQNTLGRNSYQIDLVIKWWEEWNFQRFYHQILLRWL